MTEEKNENQNPLTLNELVNYNQEVLFPALEERFVTKTDFNGLKTDFNGLKTEFKELKNEFKEFKNETLTGQDKILKKLDILLTEKTIREYREEKEKELWAIVLKALKEHRILSPSELEEIAKLRIF